MKRVCAKPGCPNGTEGRYCQKHKPKGETYTRYSKEARVLYDARWWRYRRVFLKKNPLCAEHAKNGMVVAANVVDHIIPHRGSFDLFWQATNHQALCTTCHNEKSGREVVHRGTGAH